MDLSMSSSGQAQLLIRNQVRSPVILASGNLRNISPKKDEVGSRRKLATSIPAPPSSRSSTVPQPIKIDGTLETRHMSLMANVFRSVDQLIHKYLDLPLRPSIDPERVLSGNFAPVPELAPTVCEVIRGSIPTWLDGAYVRNGPNPQFHPAGPYHLFEGDGMLHLIRISGGKATLCSRYVQTHKYLAERAAGSPVIPNFYSSFNGIPAAAMRVILASARALACHYNPANGIGLANTGVARIGHSLYALGESDLPYAIRVTGDGDVETVGRSDFNGALSQSMTAHPKLDADTGEVFAFQYNALHPFLTYFRIDPDGTKTHEVPISSLTRPSFFHDFAVTKKYAIFCDSQLGINSFKKIIQGGPLVGADLSKVPRLGVLPLYAADDSEMRWFDVPGFNMVHSVNAWDDEETNEIILVAPNAQSIGHALEQLDLGKKNTYAYAAIGDPLPKIKGVVKLDVTGGEEAVVGRRMYGEGCFGGETCFVARDPCDPDAEEDDGCLVTYLHDESTGESRFLVMDAKSANLEVLAEVKLPQRVPYGFHGLFVRESNLGQPGEKFPQTRLETGSGGGKK